MTAFKIGEELDRLLERRRGLKAHGFHDPTLAEDGRLVKYIASPLPFCPSKGQELRAARPSQ
jgi:hypothetical protein